MIGNFKRLLPALLSYNYSQIEVVKGFSVFAAFFGEELAQIWPDVLTVITNKFLSDYNLESVGIYKPANKPALTT